MSTSRHKFFVTIVSVALTCLLIGGSAIGYYVYGAYQAVLRDPEYLRKRLEAVNEANGAAKSLPRQAALVRVAEARRDLIDSIRPFHGKLKEVQIAKISSEVSGLVVELPIEVGQRVKGGETLIAQIDKTWIELAVEQTEAEIAILEKQYEFQMSEAERVEALAVSRAVSESELNNQRTLVEQFRRNLEKAVIANKEAREKLKRTTIMAPFDGYVVRRDVGLGELLAPGTTIAEIVSLGHVDAVVNVVEDIIDRIKIGDEVPIIIDKLGVKVVGKVHSIVPYNPTAKLSFPVIIRLNDRDGQLKVGMSATAIVASTDLREEIVVTKDAVLDKPDGAVVWIAVEETDDTGEIRTFVRPVPVRITAHSLTDYGVQPITEEGKKLLVAGVKTVIEGAERLVPDQRIRITEIRPELLENLPPSSGHKIIEPKERIGR